MALTVMQLLPALEAGGVERGTVEVARGLVEHGHRAIVVSAGGRLVPAVTAAGAEHVTLDIGRKSLLTLRHARTLARLMAVRDVDIVHARSRLPAWIGMLALRRLGASAPRLVTTVHGPYSVNRYSAVMTRGERIIAISEFIRDYITGHYPAVDPACIRVIHRGVSAAEFPHGYRPGSEWLARWHADHPGLRGRTLLTLVARITRWKGQEDFIELVRRLRANGTDVHGLLVGGVEPRRRGFRRELQRRVDAAGLGAHVSFLGHRDDVREIMSMSALVLSLARVPEAFGRTALEALSLGVPVAGYDHGGTAEILRALFPEGRVAPGDIPAAADCVARILARRPSISEQQPFTLQRMVEETLQVYAELAGHRP